MRDSILNFRHQSHELVTSRRQSFTLDRECRSSSHHEYFVVNFPWKHRFHTLVQLYTQHSFRIVLQIVNRVILSRVTPN